MNEQEKKSYLEKYKKAKEKGVPFFPDILAKDAVAALIIFLVLVALAYFAGAPLEERANPADATYNPRPEWYFLFLFQLLKYFPGELEVLGVVVIPTIAILILFLLPILDKHAKRHFSTRIWVIAVTSVLGVGAIFLTVQSIREIPPPSEAAVGDPIAALYIDNCAGCHGMAIDTSSGVNLHQVIAEGKHEGMPAWTADLTTDEIDALAGFILSPVGNTIFNNNCGECHEVADLVAGNPLTLKSALEDGKGFAPHGEAEIPDWNETLSRGERTTLLNFLIAPDGQRLFALYCSSCHGTSAPFTGDREELVGLISDGGMHLEMPSWQEKLTSSEIETLARFTMEPSAVPEGGALFTQNCASCHGSLIPNAPSYEDAVNIITTGGAHETMPVWGEILTTEQIDALVQYTLDAARGTPLELGQQLFASNCANCHGDFGEGGGNPARPDDIIAPISTSEYLQTRDNFTLKSIISQGQPNFGMSPFGTAFGGPLDDTEVDALVTFIRSWEANPPVELPPEVFEGSVVLDAQEIYDAVCAQCHGANGEGITGPSLQDAGFRNSNSTDDITVSISEGHSGTGMIAWGEILTAGQIGQLVDLIDQLPIVEAPPEGADPGTGTDPSVTEVPKVVSFADDVMPIFEDYCIGCHGTAGGWDGESYDAVMNTGDNAPVIIPGDTENSLLAQKILGTHEEGDPMPPFKSLSDRNIQTVLDWIAGGALDN